MQKHCFTSDPLPIEKCFDSSKAPLWILLLRKERKVYLMETVISFNLTNYESFRIPSSPRMDTEEKCAGNGFVLEVNETLSTLELRGGN